MLAHLCALLAASKRPVKARMHTAKGFTSRMEGRCQHLAPVVVRRVGSIVEAKQWHGQGQCAKRSVAAGESRDWRSGAQKRERHTYGHIKIQVIARSSFSMHVRRGQEQASGAAAPSIRCYRGAATCAGAAGESWPAISCCFFMRYSSSSRMIPLCNFCTSKGVSPRDQDAPWKRAARSGRRAAVLVPCCILAHTMASQIKSTVSLLVVTDPSHPLTSRSSTCVLWMDQTPAAVSKDIPQKIAALRVFIYDPGLRAWGCRRCECLPLF